MKKLVTSISNRLPSNSLNKKVYDKSKGENEKTLRGSGYN